MLTSPDLWEFAAALLLVLFSLALGPADFAKGLKLLSNRPRAAALLFFLLAVVSRLVLLRRHPIPVPHIYDEFSHLLAADTLWHVRLANPVHAMHRFFETFFVLQVPSYSSIYPLGQALVLVWGRLLSGIPWAGVLFVSGLLPPACFWMLRAYIPAPWPLIGALLAFVQFGPLSSWTNSYWGGGLAAAAGCLVFGSLPRIGRALRDGRNAAMVSVLLGFGFGLHLLTRQFESLFLGLAILLYGLLFFRTRAPVNTWFLATAPAAGVLGLFLALIAAQNRAVTGSWHVLPEQLSQSQYGVPTTLTFQRPASPHIELTPSQFLQYKAQRLMHGEGPDTFSKFLGRLLIRVRVYRFYFLPPLYLLPIGFLIAARRQWRYRVVLLWLLLFACGTNFFPYLLPHYLAACTSLFTLVAVGGLAFLVRLRFGLTPIGQQLAMLIVTASFVPFSIWYSSHLFEGEQPPWSFLQYESGGSLNHAAVMDRRTQALAALQQLKQPLLVFVHYLPRHIFQDEWVWNAADIDSAPIVFARDLGDAKNAKLKQYYPDRTVVWLQPDIDPPSIALERPE